MHRPLSVLAALAVIAAVAVTRTDDGASRTGESRNADLRYLRRHWLDHHIAQGRDLHVHAVPAGTA